MNGEGVEKEEVTEYYAEKFLNITEMNGKKLEERPFFKLTLQRFTRVVYRPNTGLDILLEQTLRGNETVLAQGYFSEDPRKFKDQVLLRSPEFPDVKEEEWNQAIRTLTDNAFDVDRPRHFAVYGGIAKIEVQTLAIGNWTPFRWGTADYPWESCATCLADYCQEEVNNANLLIKFPCNHTSHKVCVYKLMWTDRQRGLLVTSCPLCTRVIG